MHLHRKKNSATAQRAADRREREELAPRLVTSVPTLQTLRISIEDRYPLGVTKHVRHVMVGRAPALFVIACGDSSCDSEGHDITSEVMRALFARSESLTSESRCDGNVGTAQCSRTMHFTIQAVYAARA